jgi:hypothetical protein
VNGSIATAIAVLAVVAPATARAGEDAVPAEVDVRTERRPGKWTHQHGLGLGYHAVFLGTESADRYSLHGPSIAYDYYVGGRWGFFARVAGFLLVSGRMTGPSGEFTASLLELYDEDHYGADLTLMAARRLPLSSRLVVTAGFGPHAQGFALTGAEYSPVEDISVGVGAVGKLDYAINGWLSVAGQLATGFDLFDAVDHKNPARWVVPLSTSISLGGRH